jgi:hypothetical protein
VQQGGLEYYLGVSLVAIEVASDEGGQDFGAAFSDLTWSLEVLVADGGNMREDTGVYERFVETAEEHGPSESEDADDPAEEIEDDEKYCGDQRNGQPEHEIERAPPTLQDVVAAGSA